MFRKTVCIFSLVCIKNRLAGFAYGVKYFANSAHQHEQAVEDGAEDKDEGKEVAEELELDPFTTIQFTISGNRLIIEAIDAEQSLVCFGNCYRCPGRN